MLIVCCNLLSEMLFLLPLIPLYFSRLFHHACTSLFHFLLILLNLALTNTLCTFLCIFLHFVLSHFLDITISDSSIFCLIYCSIFGGKTHVLKVGFSSTIGSFGLLDLNIIVNYCILIYILWWWERLKAYIILCIHRHNESLLSHVLRNLTLTVWLEMINAFFFFFFIVLQP